MFKVSLPQIFKIVVALVVGIVLSQLPLAAGLERSSMIYVGVFIAMVVLMAAKAVPDFVAVLAACGTLVIFKVGALTEVFAPFAGGTVWQIISILAFAVAAQKGSLLSLITLNVLKPFKPTYMGQVAAVMTAITILNFMIPSSFAKVAMLAPVVINICDHCGYKKNSKEAAGLLIAVFIPAIQCSFAFTTGSTAWSYMIGFMQTETFHPTFTFTSWLASTWVWVVVMMVGTYLFIGLFNRPKDGGLVNKEFVNDTIAKLPPLTAKDKINAVILLVSIVLWMTESLHGLNGIGITIVAVFFYFVTGILTPQEFKANVDWPTVMLIGGILCLAGFTSTLGLSDVLANLLGPVAEVITSHIAVMIIVVCIITFVLRYVFVSNAPIILVVCAALLPVLFGKSIHPFVLVFTLHQIGACFQTSYNYILLPPVYPLTQDRLAEHKALVPYAYAYPVICTLGLLASIPMWNSLGYLG
ncbi:transporter [Clostridia bacterium]|nr:transporter [Clostridia bacterium]